MPEMPECKSCGRRQCLRCRPSGLFFRISVFLRQAKCVFKAHLILNHAGQDEIRRAVEDPGNLVNFIGCQALADRPDNRDSSANACLKEEIDVVFFSGLKQFVPFRRYKPLLEVTTLFPALRAGEHIFIRRMQAAHRFNNDLNFLIL